MSTRRDVVLFVVLLLAIRALLVLAALDPAEERVAEIIDPAGLSASWPRGPERPLYDREELYTGTAARAMRMGLDVPVRFTSYGGGSFLLSHLARPIQAVFGTSYLALKLIPLLVTLVGGLCWLLTTRHWLGPRAALAFAALYLFAPSNLVRTALIAKGDHPEAMAWVGVVLYLATRCRFATGESGALRWGFAAGTAAGLGVYVTYSTVPIVAAVLAGGLLLSRLRPRRVWLAVLGGLATGLLPWLAHVVDTGGRALKIYGQPVGAGTNLAEAVDRVALLFDRGLLAGYDLPGGAAVRSMGDWLWLSVVVVAWVSLVRMLRYPERRAVAWLILLGTGAHLAAFCLSAPDASSRYLMPVFPLLLIAVASLAKAHRLGKLVVTLVVVLGLVAQTTSVAGGRFTVLQAPIAGTDWALFGGIAGSQLKPERIEALPGRVRPFFWVGLGHGVFWALDRSNWKRVFAAVPLSAMPHVWQGIGEAWTDAGSLEKAGPQLRFLPDASRAALRQGIAHYGAGTFAPRLARHPASLGPLLAQFATEDRPALEDSMARVGATFALHEIPAPALPPDLLSPRASDWGLGYALYRGFGHGSPLTWAPAPVGGPAFAEGLAAAFEHDLNTRNATWLLGEQSTGPHALGKLLAANTADLPEHQAEVLYIAAGRAARRAWLQPGVETRDGEQLESWPWRDAIPARFHTNFAAGLRPD